MYAITAKTIGGDDEILVYNDKYTIEETTIVSATLSLEVNMAGSLEITIPPTNQAYSAMEPFEGLTTEFIVYRNDLSSTFVEYWRGRVIMVDSDFWNNKVFTCEGELAYLNDTIQYPKEYNNTSISTFLRGVLTQHNDHVLEDAYKFYLGNVDVDGDSVKKYRSTNYENTWTCINEKLLDKYSGIIRLRKENGRKYIDYLEDYPVINDQEIMYGENLLDISKKYDFTNFATAVIPLGARLEHSRYADLDEYLTIAAVSYDDEIRIVNDETASWYGLKEVVLYFDDVDDPTTLYNKGVKYLNQFQYNKMELEITALDLHYVDKDISSISLLDYIGVFSKPHNLSMKLPVTRMEIPILEPSRATITLNGSKRGVTNKLSYLAKDNNIEGEKLAAKLGMGIITNAGWLSPSGMGQMRDWATSQSE